MIQRVWLLFAMMLALCAQVAICGADYYKILGVPKDASIKDIKKAYRNLSREYHPDKNPGDEKAEQKFIEIAGAYEVLSDEEQRQKYDRYGEEGLKGGMGGGGRGGHPGNMNHAFDMFQHFFGGHGFGAQQHRRGQDLQAHIEVTLQDQFKGTTVPLTFDLQGICDECDGTGSADGKAHKCPDCQGAGFRVMRQQLAPGMVQQIQVPCDKCRGTGNQITTPCSICKGNRVIRENRSYKVAVEAGSPKRSVHKFRGEADQSPDYDAGDLIINISEAKHGNMGYRRRGRHLFRKEVLSAKEALNGGWKRAIPYLDGKSTIDITRKAGQKVLNGHIDIIKGKGMPKFHAHGQGHDQPQGDLYIEYVVVLPAGSKSSHVDL